jgi:hypothetical protein
LAQQSLSDPQAAIAIGPNERPILAEHCRYSEMTEPDPKRPFLNITANVRYGIAKQSSNCRDQLCS